MKEKRGTKIKKRSWISKKGDRLAKMGMEKLNGGCKRKKGEENSKEEMEIQKKRQISKNGDGKVKRGM